VIAHEIRNPLMIIRASLSSLRQDRLSAPELHEAVSDIDEETRRLNQIVTDVLDFARPMKFQLTPANINDICKGSAEAAWTGDPGSIVALDLDQTIPTVVTDAERLRTALVNILTNARHAVGAVPRAATGTNGRPPASVEQPGVILRTSHSRDRVLIVIRDRGIGILPEDMPHIFDPYFTTRRAGTGLGLPIAKNIIEGLGGVISVSSRPGEGTEITIDLPVVSVERQA
jgi:signal transduction histidine kinase